MKKMLALLVASTLAFTLAGCASLHKDETMRVKCPACGYEFEAPIGGA